MTYIWPTKLLVPVRPPKLVYLDLNHWVSLSKAQAGHRAGDQFNDVLAACGEAVSRGAAMFPLSDSIYFEVSKIGTYRQRRDLREVMERLSGFMVVTSRSVVSVHEIETMLDAHIGPSRDPINEMRYIDWGVMRAFGIDGGIVIRDRTGADVTEEARAKHPGGPEEFDRILWKARLGLNRSVIDGPTAEEEPAMRASGWNPGAAYAVAERRAQQEIEQVARFNADPAWRRGRIRPCRRRTRGRHRGKRTSLEGLRRPRRDARRRVPPGRKHRAAIRPARDAHSASRPTSRAAWRRVARPTPCSRSLVTRKPRHRPPTPSYPVRGGPLGQSRRRQPCSAAQRGTTSPVARALQAGPEDRLHARQRPRGRRPAGPSRRSQRRAGLAGEYRRRDGRRGKDFGGRLLRPVRVRLSPGKSPNKPR